MKVTVPAMVNAHSHAFQTDLRGTGPDRAPIEVALGAGQTVLFFLTTSCVGCRVIWEGLAARAEAGPAPASG